jgi:hypothetical protein
MLEGMEKNKYLKLMFIMEVKMDGVFLTGELSSI